MLSLSCLLENKSDFQNPLHYLKRFFMSFSAIIGEYLYNQVFARLKWISDDSSLIQKRHSQVRACEVPYPEVLNNLVFCVVFVLFVLFLFSFVFSFVFSSKFYYQLRAYARLVLQFVFTETQMYPGHFEAFNVYKYNPYFWNLVLNSYQFSKYKYLKDIPYKAFYIKARSLYNVNIYEATSKNCVVDEDGFQTKIKKQNKKIKNLEKLIKSDIVYSEEKPVSNRVAKKNLRAALHNNSKIVKQTYTNIHKQDNSEENQVKKLVFEEGNGVSRFLESLTFDKLPEIFGSYKKMEAPKFKTPAEALEFEESKRQLEFLLAKDNDGQYRYLSDNHNSLLKDWLEKAFCSTNTHEFEIENYSIIPSSCYLVQDNQMYMDKFSSDLYFSGQAEYKNKNITEGKGKKKVTKTVSILVREGSQPVLRTLTNFGDIKECLDSIPKNKTFSSTRLKSTLKNLVKQGLSREDILTYFHRRLKLWKQGTSMPLKELLQTYSWFTPYFRPSFMFLEVDEKQILKFVNSLYGLVCGLRNRIYSFVHNYLDISYLSKSEREGLLLDRKNKFANIMRSPEIQMMFSFGHSKQYIVDFIYKTKLDQITKQSIKESDIDLKKESVVHKRQRNIIKARDAKYQLLEYEPTSNPMDIIFPHIKTFVDQSIRPLIATALTLVCVFFYRLQNLFGKVNTHYDLAIKNLERVRNFNFKDLQFISSEEKLMIVECKALISTICSMYLGDTSSAVSHASYFALTRPGELVPILAIASLQAFKMFYTSPTCSVKIDGVDLTLTSQQFHEVCEKYDKKEKIDVDSIYQATAMPLDSVVNGLSSLLSYYNISNMDSADIRKANEQFAYMNNVKRTVSERTSTIMCVLSIACRMLFAYDPLDQEFQKFTSEIIDVVSQVEEFSMLQLEYSKDKNKMLAIIRLNERANELSKHPRMNTVPSFLQRGFTKRLDELNKMAKHVNSLLHSAKHRAPPVCVLMIGPPGVGKTPFVKFATKSLSFLDHEEFSPEHVYSYNSGDEYWEAYCQQKYVVADDLFVSTDAADRRKQAEDIIKMVNIEPFNLPMAFEGKGTNFFDSEYVLLSTNLANDGYQNARWSVGITDETALQKRFDFVVYRKEQSQPDVVDNHYVVQKCPIEYKDILDKQMSSVEIIKYVHKYRQLRKERLNGNSYTVDRLQGLFKLQETVLSQDKPVEEESKFEPTAKPGEVDHYSFFMKMVSLQMYDWYQSPNMKYYVLGFGFLITLLTVKPLFDHYFADPEPTSKTKKMSNGRARNRNNKVRDIDIKKWTSLGETKPTSNQDNSLLNAYKTLSKGVLFFEFTATDKDSQFVSRHTGTGFHLKDGYVILPAHLYLRFTQYYHTEVRIVYNEREYTFPFVEECMRVSGEDIVVFKMPSHVPLPVSLYPYLLSASIAQQIPRGSLATLIAYDDEVSLVIRDCRTMESADEITYECAGERLTLTDTIRFWGKVQLGNSGGPIFISNNKGENIIVAMQVARNQRGGDSIGVGTLLCKEYIDKIIGNYVPTSSEFPFEIIKHVPISMAHNLPTRSKIKRSVIYGWNGEPKQIPVKMVPFQYNGQMFDPLALAMQKLARQPFEGYDISDRCVSYLFHLYPKIEKPEVFDFEKALNGDSEKGIPSICASTSAGYPYSLKTTKGKSPFVTLKDNKYYFDPEFLVELQEKDQRLRSGQNIEVLWADVLKDETRPREKVFAGKARLFCSCPLDYLILVRKYFLHFTSYVQQFASTKPVSVGINVHSLDWTVLYNRMKKYPSIIAGDFKDWDGKVPGFVGKKFLQYVNQWYDDGPINAQVRVLLFEHIWRAQRINGDRVYQIYDGNPSGNPNTSIYNSFCNVIMCYEILTQDLHLRTDQFDVAVYGDDNIIGVEKENVKCSDLAIFYKSRFGMTYTHFSKEEVDRVDSMDTIRYLGRSFVLKDNICQAPLELDVVVESTYWYRGGDVPDQVLLATIQSFFIEMSHFGKFIFDLYTKKLLDEVDDYDPSLAQSVLASVSDWYNYHDSMYDGKKHVKYTYVPTNKSFGSLLIWDREFQPTSKDSKFSEASNGDSNIPQYDKVEPSRNTEYTERAANPAVESQQVQLGGYHDVAPVSTGNVDPTTFHGPHNGFNMECYNLNGALAREYIIGNVSWTTTSASGAILVSYSFPEILLNQTFLLQKTNDFRYFKGGIRVTTRVVGNKFLYGSCLMFFDPVVSLNGYPQYTSPNVCSGLPHVIISASSGDTVIFDIPFINPNRAIDLLDPTAGQMGTVKIMVLNPLIDMSNTSSTANILVTAQFLEPELYYPHDNYTIDSYVATSKRSTIPSKKNEAANKAKGHDIGSYNSTKAIDSGVETVKLATDYVSQVIDVAKPVFSLMSMLGLSKPKTVDKSIVSKIDPFHDVNTGEGVDSLSTIGFNPKNQVSTLPNVGGIGLDEMAFTQLCGTPVLTNVVSFYQSATTPQILAFPLSTNPTNAFGDYVNYAEFLGNMFSYISGSKKIKIYIKASLYHSARFVLYLTDTMLSANWVNCYHRIIDVQGDTEVEFMIPWSSSKFSEQKNNPSLFTLTCFPLSWSQTDFTTNAPIYFNVYTSAASDIQYGALLDVCYTATSCPRNDFAKEFEPFHPSITGFKQDNLLYGEDYQTVREIVHRYNAVTYMNGPIYGSIVSVYPGTGSLGSKVYSGLELFGLLYRFRRGSIRFKLIHQLSGDKTAAICFLNTGSYAYSGFSVSSTTNPINELEFPWFTNQLFTSTTQDDTNLLSYTSSNQQMFVVKAAGDDFSFHFIHPPPLGTFTAFPQVSSSNAGGVRGLVNWCAGIVS